jgi:hypothetical protein
VTAENVQCGYGGVTCTKTIRAEVNGLVVELTLGRAPIINGTELAVGPTSIIDHRFIGGRIVSTQLFIVILFYDVGLEISWDKGLMLGSRKNRLCAMLRTVFFSVLCFEALEGSNVQLSFVV